MGQSHPARATATRSDLILVGGGHAHIQVLRSLAMRPISGLRTTVVVDHSDAVYSGMVPGFVAGQYREDELKIDVRPLAMRAGARVVRAAAIAVDPSAGRIDVEGRPAIAYDLASFDVGSTVAGLDCPGVAEHALTTRPIGAFVRRLEARLARGRAETIAVVGAGAGGVELACALRARLPNATLTLIEGGGEILPGAAGALRKATRRALEGLAIRLQTKARVTAVDAQGVELADGERLPADLVVWVAGAASLPLFAGTLPTNDAGFLQVRDTLQVIGHDALFGVGDCIDFPGTLPKAGVYAVRQGPILTRNLRAMFRGGALRPYRPQRDFLSLLNLGDGRAIAGKWGLAAGGRPWFALKDWIDRRFMKRFMVLGRDHQPTRHFPEMPGMDDMVCGGCAAKVGESVLSRALSRIPSSSDERVIMGLDARDDAAAVTTKDGGVLVASVDAFRAFCDDPFLVGRIAAVNAASDLWAKGIDPRFVLANVVLPLDAGDDDNEETLFQTLCGARSLFDEIGATLLGGHTGAGDALAVGFTVWGEADAGDALLTLDKLTPGQTLILSKALGTGVLFHADMQGRARGAWIDAAFSSMQRPNEAASRIAREAGARACTDVSGFGLAGHLGEMLRQSGVGARIDTSSLPALAGANELLRQGLRSTFHPENAKARKAIHIDNALRGEPTVDLLFDPQTSGGLLFAVASERAADTLAALKAAGDSDAAAIGMTEAPDSQGALFSLVPLA